MSAAGADLEALEKGAAAEIAAAASVQDLTEVRARILGKKGSLSEVLRGIGRLAPEERGPAGQNANAAKQRIEAGVAERRAEIERAGRDQNLAGLQLDTSLPAAGGPRGRLHPLTLVMRDVERFFVSRGYSIEEGPEVETEWYNFDALGIASDHPARDMQDTIWVEDGFVMRTHTSPVQIRAMSGLKPPFRFISPGRVYRHDFSPRHSPMFQQVEGMAVAEDITFGDLKGILYDFARHMMGSDIDLRFRSSFFPFTEPSAEIDFECLLCAGEGCATCSQSGWIEWGGCGMIHPQVLRNCDIDPERYQGFAFGMGIERAAMLRQNIPQIRLLYDGDVRVLEQF